MTADRLSAAIRFPNLDAAEKAERLRLWPGVDDDGRWFVCESPAAGEVAAIHCGPYSSSNDAWNWILGVQEASTND